MLPPPSPAPPGARRSFRPGSVLEGGLDAERDVALEGVADRAAVLGGFGGRHEVGGATCPGREPRTVSALDTTRQPASSLSNVTSAVTSSRSGGVPARPSPADNAIEKHAAWAAATSSSGLVSPSDDSVRADQDTGREVNAPDEIADTAPEPVARLAATRWLRRGGWRTWVTPAALRLIGFDKSSHRRRRASRAVRPGWGRCGRFRAVRCPYQGDGCTGRACPYCVAAPAATIRYVFTATRRLAALLLAGMLVVPLAAPVGAVEPAPQDPARRIRSRRRSSPRRSSTS